MLSKNHCCHCPLPFLFCLRCRCVHTVPASGRVNQILIVRLALHCDNFPKIYHFCEQRRD